MGRLCNFSNPPPRLKESNNPTDFFAQNPKNVTKISIKFRDRSWLQDTSNFIGILNK